MTAQPNKLKIPSADDYQMATLELDLKYPDIEAFIGASKEEACALPRGFFRALGELARKAIPLEDERPERLKLCRAIGYGAGVGAMIAEAAHQYPKPLNECGNFDVLQGDDSPQEFIMRMHEETDEGLPPIIGESTVAWLDNHAQATVGAGIIDDDFQSWYVIGAGQSIGLVYANAVVQAQ
jgi:hypothetical protein